MASLPQAGVQLIAEGLPEFVSSIAKGEKATETLGEAAQKSAAKIASLGEKLGNQNKELGILQQAPVGAARRHEVAGGPSMIATMHHPDAR